ncbi:hypothetical protein DFH06DRAFT_1102218 [Mycena polygramma]|nr:hypothetical protein DFH06DRAFT_1102218 [Mycena polygramma]
MVSPSFVALVALLTSVRVANAWFRVACTDPLVQERIDPIISPGAVPSQHVHTIHGASNFGPNSTYDSLRASDCTSCEVIQDHSNYWFPKLYFRDPKTKSFEAVANGGLLVYYQNRGDGDKSNGGAGLKAFPPGLRMITGDPTRRSKKYTFGLGTQEELRERAIQWVCLRYSANETDVYNNGNATAGFPDTDCESGFNARLHMPACWDGIRPDSPDHQSHVAYLSDLDNGSCPPGFPVYMMKARSFHFFHQNAGLIPLFYEVTWNVHDFSSRWNASNGDKWPFVYSTGDPTGFSWHGDFQNGWDTTALQSAIDQCNNPNDPTGSGITAACNFLNVTPAAFANQCKIAPVTKEVVNGTLTKLPGCNPLQSGPQNATIHTEAKCPASD